MSEAIVSLDHVGKDYPFFTLDDVYIVLLYFSGLFIPLPDAISSIVLASPCFYLHQLLLEGIGAENYLVVSVGVHVVVLVAVTLVCLGIALRRLERTI